MQHLLEKQSHWKNAAVLLLWTTVAFLYSFLAKKFLILEAEILSHYVVGFWKSFASAGILTTMQIYLAYIFVDVEMESPSIRGKVRIAHIIATFATNISMAVTFASSTFAVKLSEPLISALVQYFTLRTVLLFEDMLTLPVIVGGAVAFCGNPLTNTNMSLGVFSAMISSLALALRNVALKSKTSKIGTKFNLHPRAKNFRIILLCSTLLLTFCLVTAYDNLHKDIPKAALVCLLSAFFNVLHTVISTGTVLTHMSVGSHAVANIMKRVMVVLLLYMFGRRVATAENFLGLGICTVGLFIYAWDKKKKECDMYGPKQHTMKRMACLRSRTGLLGFVYSIIVISYLLIRGWPVSKPTLSRNLFSEKAWDSFDLKFTYNAYKKPDKQLLQPDFNGSLANLSSQVLVQFLNDGHKRNPEHINFISEKLKTSSEIIKESQRIHFELFDSELKKYKYAVLFDVAAYENKGDPCISVGEIYFLAKVHVDIIYYCETRSLSPQSLDQAKGLASLYTPDEVVILLSGGGNMVGYFYADLYRFDVFKIFAGYHIFLFPQSIRMVNTSHPHFQHCVDNYCCNENFTLVLRDLQSYGYAKEYFNGSTKLLMAPDMSFQIGHIPRFMSPVFDIMWLRREDRESPNFWEIPEYPKGIRVHVSDWWDWKTPNASIDIEKAFYVCTNGFFYLQRGRVIVTDRLHGHILATLMNIPHVLVDNKARKLSSYHNTWTRSLENIFITDDPSKALDLAISLLDKYKHVLPPRVPYLHASHANTNRIENFDRPDESYV